MVVADHAREVDAGEVARVPAGLADGRGLLRVAARERDVVPALDQEPRERRAPRSRADDDDVHSERWKSIDTGTPWSSNRERSSFSTQYP